MIFLRRFKKLAYSASLIAILAVQSAPTFAAGEVPVRNPRGLIEMAKQFTQMLEDYDLQTDQLDTMIQQLETLHEQYVKLQEIERLISDPTEVLSMIIDPDLAGVLQGDINGSMIEAVIAGTRGDWSSVINDSSNGIFGKAVTDALKSAGTSQEEVTAQAESDNERAQRNAQVTASNAMTSAAAEVAYKEAEQMVERTTILVEQIADLDGLKASVDHNTRVLAEQSIALAALWQLEAVQTMNVGLTGVVDAATLAEVQKFYDFSIPEIAE